MTTILLETDFTSPQLDARLAWYCPPSRWGMGEGRLWVEPAAKTDYWQRTHYGFRVDNGPFLYIPVETDFILSARVRFFPLHQYDQAGLMVRISSDAWIKTSVEFEPGEASKMGAVVTNGGFSDWSTQDFPYDSNELELRIRRTGDDYLVEHVNPETGAWVQLRMAHLHNAEHAPVQCGFYACSPIDAGFRAEVDYLKIEI